MKDIIGGPITRHIRLNAVILTRRIRRLRIGWPGTAAVRAESWPKTILGWPSDVEAVGTMGGGTAGGTGLDLVVDYGPGDRGSGGAFGGEGVREEVERMEVRRMVGKCILKVLEVFELVL